ncbi:hypothetical protein [Clostridium paraputrificum]|uniref:SF4 helicase domain-containing protein n=1 Tax=Clostridium paraputrificum TaxID=29363 RepID=A0A6N3F496_9CLOT
MIKLNFYSDEGNNELQLALEDLLSCVLPHENFKGELFILCIESINHMIKREEMPVPHGVLMKILQDFAKLKSCVDFESPELSKDHLDAILVASLEEYVKANRREVTEWALDLGTQLNLEIGTDMEKSFAMIYQETIDLYDRCFDKACKTAEYKLYLLRLRNAFKGNALYQSLIVESKILQSSEWIGKRRYAGFDDCLDYKRTFLAELTERLEDVEENTKTINSVLELEALRKENREKSKRLADYGIPQLDDVTPILTNRLVTICGDPGVGKTLMMTYLTARLLVNKIKVCYMCGENPRNKIYNMIIASYIGLRYGMFVTSAQVAGIEDCSEDAERIIRVAELEVMEENLLTTREYFTYDNAYDEMKSVYESTGSVVYMVDHSAALRSAPGSKLFTNKDRLDCAAIQYRNFKKDFPVGVIVASHLSVDGSKEAIKFGKVMSAPTRDSSILDKESDEEFILLMNETLKKQNLIEMQIKKRRDKEAPSDHIILSQDKEFIQFEYRPELQGDVAESISKQEAINRVASSYEMDADDDFDNLFDDDDF